MEGPVLSQTAAILGVPESSLEPLSGGANNQVFRYRDRVVKVSGLPDTSRILREFQALQWARSQGIPVPNVYEQGTQGALSFFTMSYLEGTLVSTAWGALPPLEKQRIATQAKDILLTLHRAPVISQLPEFPCDRIHSAVASDRLLQHPSDLQDAHSQCINSIVTLIRGEIGARTLERSSQSSVTTHGDFGAGNLLMDTTGRVWVIDFDSVYAAPGVRDAVGIVYESLDWTSGAQLLTHPPGDSLLRPIITTYTELSEEIRISISYLRFLFIERVLWFLERALNTNDLELLQRAAFYGSFFFEQSDEQIITKLLG